MWPIILSLLEGIGMRLLGALFQTVTQTAQANGVDSAALDYVNQEVNSAEENPLLDTGDKKFAEVYRDCRAYFTQHWPDVSSSFLKGIIELTVHNLHNGQQAAQAPNPPASPAQPPPKNAA